MKRNKFTARPPQPIGDILSAAFKKRGMAFRLEENNVFKLWPKAVGEQIAAQTKPDRLNAGTLFVRTTSSVWVHELHFMKEDIRNKLNQLARKTAVRDIHFTVGYQPPKTHGTPGDNEAKHASLKARDKKMIDECTETLADRELAEIVKRVMKKEISRRRMLEAKTDR